MENHYLPTPAGICLTAVEIQDLTGYAQTGRQIEELRTQGFWRARARDGRVIVERSHFEAVCAGVDVQRKILRPKVGPLRG